MKGHVAVKTKKNQVSDPTSLAEVWDISDHMTKQIAKRAFQLFEECGRPTDRSGLWPPLQCWPWSYTDRLLGDCGRKSRGPGRST